MRMKDESLTKVAVLGWYKKLEGVSKAPGKKRKTMLYWKRMLSEAGIDWTDVGRLASDRSGWKKLVKERMDHLDVYERQLAHGYVWGDGEERLVRNERRVNEDLRCRYEGCERLCRSRAGLVRHENMMHRRVEGRVRFVCEDCDLEVATKGALVCHRRTCGAGRRLEDGRRECGGCGARVSYANFARHVRSCRAGGRGAAAVGDGGGGLSLLGGGGADDGGGVGGGWVMLGANGVGRGRGGGGGGVGRRVSCQFCGRELNVTYGTWRGTSASPAGCRIREGGGLTAVSGEWPKEGRKALALIQRNRNNRRKLRQSFIYTLNMKYECK